MLAASAAWAGAQASQPAVVSTIYICAGYTGTALTTAQYNASTCAATGGVTMRGSLQGYAFNATRSSYTPPSPPQASIFSINRSLLDGTGVNMEESVLSGTSLGTIAIGVNSVSGRTETNQFTFVLQGAAVAYSSVSVSSTGPAEDFGLTYTSLTIYDNVTGRVINYGAPSSSVAALSQGAPGGKL